MKKDKTPKGFFNEEKLIPWKKEWKGMPEFIQEDLLTSTRSIIIHFETKEDVDKFSELIGQKIMPKTKSIWFPKAKREPFGRCIDES